MERALDEKTLDRARNQGDSAMSHAAVTSALSPEQEVRRWAVEFACRHVRNANADAVLAWSARLSDFVLTGQHPFRQITRESATDSVPAEAKRAADPGTIDTIREHFRETAELTLGSRELQEQSVGDGLPAVAGDLTRTQERHFQSSVGCVETPTMDGGDRVGQDSIAQSLSTAQTVTGRTTEEQELV